MQKQPNEGGTEGAVRLVTFEASSLRELREEVDRWIEGTPDLRPISFSHAVRERRGGPPMGAGRTFAFTGTLLVRAA